MVIGNSKEFINGSALSHEGHIHSQYSLTSHKHSANDITSGILPVSRGGTGTTSISGLKSVLGLSDVNIKKALISSLTKTYGPYSKTYTSYNGYENIMMSLPVNTTLIPLVFEFDFTFTLRSTGACRMYYDSGTKEYVSLDFAIGLYYNYSSDDLNNGKLYISKYISNVFYAADNLQLTTSSPVTKNNNMAKMSINSSNYNYLNPVIQIHTANQAYYTGLYVDLSYNAYLIGIE